MQTKNAKIYHKQQKLKKSFLQLLVPIFLVISFFAISRPEIISYQCGTGQEAVVTSIDFGCRGDACVSTTQSPPKWCSPGGSVAPISPIIDLVFAVIRFLTDGIGLVIVASIIYAGIQYTTAGGDPNNVTKAVKRIRSSVTALVLFIFMYAILNYLIPYGFFKT